MKLIIVVADDSVAAESGRGGEVVLVSVPNEVEESEGHLYVLYSRDWMHACSEDSGKH